MRGSIGNPSASPRKTLNFSNNAAFTTNGTLYLLQNTGANVNATINMSGSAAVTFSILNIAGAGDHVVSANSLYGGTYNLFVHTLPRFGLDVELVDPNDPENFRRAIRPETKQVLMCATRSSRLIDGLAGTDLEGRLTDDLGLFVSPSRRIDGTGICAEALEEAGQPVYKRRGNDSKIR